MLLHLLLMVLKEIVFVSVSFSSRNRNLCHNEKLNLHRLTTMCVSQKLFAFQKCRKALYSTCFIVCCPSRNILINLLCFNDEALTFQLYDDLELSSESC